MTRAIAHRGASAYQPENTIAAFRAAVAFGAHGIELDVHGSADGVVVVHHDPVIDGVAIGDVSYDELTLRMRAAKKDIPPTLPAALDAIGPSAIVYIEIKSLRSDHDDALFRVVADAPDPDNCEVHAFDHRIVRRLRLACPDLRGGVLSASYPVNPIEQMNDALADTLWQQDALIDAALVDQIHTADKSIIAWTVDDEDRMRELQTMGVDGVCSNKPDVACRVLT